MIIAMSIGNTNFVLGTKEDNQISVGRYPAKLIGSKEDFIKIITESTDIKKAE